MTEHHVNFAQHLPGDQRLQPRLCQSWGSRGSPGSYGLLQGIDNPYFLVVGCDWSHPSRPYTCDPKPWPMQSPGREAATDWFGDQTLSNPAQLCQMLITWSMYYVETYLFQW